MAGGANAVVQIGGPWAHRSISANGTRFHAAEAGDGPLVLLLHGFPEFWWTWRHQLAVLPEAGFRAVAVDLRGYGGSDKPPRGYDLVTAASDAAGLVRALGEANAIVVGHGLGGLVGWTLAAYYPKVIRRLAVISMAHPLRMRASVVTDLLGQGRRSGYALASQLPIWPERQLLKDGAYQVGRLLEKWSAPGWPDPETEQIYSGRCGSPPPRTPPWRPPLAGAQRRAARRAALRPAHADSHRGPRPAPARRRGHLRAAADRARRRALRRRPVPLAGDRRRRALPARGTPGGAGHRAARLAGRPGTGALTRDRDPAGRPRTRARATAWGGRWTAPTALVPGRTGSPTTW